MRTTTTCRPNAIPPRVGLVMALAGAVVQSLAAQETAVSAKGLPPAIEDNSFFIEEAYNQEDGVVQHVSTFSRFGAPLRVSDYSFTQEWPVRGRKHQLSVTLPYSWSDLAGAGFGDSFLNYRYQLLGHDDWAAFSPRLSVVLPTGGPEQGTLGVQVNLPASKRINAWLVMHANAGATLLPATETRGFNVGASAIGLVTKSLNLMLEVASTFTGEPDPSGRRRYARETTFSPGLRCAIDVGALQIVPGLAVPFRKGGGRRTTGVFAYLVRASVPAH